MGLGPLVAASAFWFTRYLAVVPRPLLTAALVVRRRYLIVVPRPIPAAPLVVFSGTLSWCPGRYRGRDAAAAGEEQLC